MNPDVIIIGGAAVGSAAAFFLASSPGFKGRVLVLEQDLGFEFCATARSAASIRHQFSTPGNIAMSRFGTEFLRRLPEHLSVDGVAPDVGFHEGGYLFLATAAGEAVLRENHATQRQMGADVALLDPHELDRRFPWLHTADLAGGSLGLSGEGWFDAWALMQAFRRKAQSLGVQYRQARVVSLQRDGRRITAVGLADGTSLACGTVINAAGTGATALARSAGLELPVQARKRCVFYVTSPARLPHCPLVIDPSGAYFRPEGAGFICGIAPEAIDDPESHDFEVQHELFDGVLWPLLAARVPGFEALRVQRSWAGHYDMNTLDANVILGAHPAVDNLLFANGFSGHGLQQSPAIGRALAELVTDGRFATLDLEAFGWQRVLEGRPLVERNVV
jgi:FAD-dependent oxidoreductase domain-containing protein 1